MIQVATYRNAGGPVEVHLVSRHMQPAVYSLQLVAKGSPPETVVDRDVLIDGLEDRNDLPGPNAHLDQKILRAVATVSLFTGPQYEVEIRVIQDGDLIGRDRAAKQTSDQSVGLQFLFLLRGV